MVVVDGEGRCAGAGKDGYLLGRWHKVAVIGGGVTGDDVHNHLGLSGVAERECVGRFTTFGNGAVTG